MSVVQDHRNAIVAKMQAVPNIGQVQSYERYAKREADFRTFYEDSGKVLGWVVRRLKIVEKSPAMGRWDVRITWRVAGYMSLDDSAASELAFDELVETLRTAFRDDPTLGGAVDTTIVPERAGLEVEDAGPVMFAGVLCHSARLGLTTKACF